MKIVYLTDKNYVKYLNISAESVLRHNPNAKILVISNEPLDIKYPNMVYEAPKEFLEKLRFNEKERLTALTYYKLLLPEILPNDDKIIYIDCDTMVQKPLDDIWNMDCPYLCVTEHYLPNNYPGHPKCALAGFLLMNLKALREDNFREKCMQNMDYPQDFWGHDESLINLNYQDKLTYIDIKYHYCKGRAKHYNETVKATIDENEAYILHFPAITKRFMERMHEDIVMMEQRKKHSIPNKLASIILSCHNSKKEYIEQLLQGLYEQTYNNWELIVCDHGSDISTKDWFPNDKRIKYLGEYNHDDQWQYMINNAQGDIIIHHHDDDISLPNRVELQVKYLQNNPQLDACSGGIITFGATNGIKVCWTMKNEELQRQLIFRQHIMAPTLATRRNVKIDLDTTGKVAKVAKDFEWLSRRCDIKQDIINHILVKYRKHNSSDTSLNGNQIAIDHANIVCRNLKTRFNIEAPFELGELLNPHINEVAMAKERYEYSMSLLNMNKDKIITFCGEKLYNQKISQINAKKIIFKG